MGLLVDTDIGWREELYWCDRCEELHYGDPEAKNCAGEQP